MSNPRAVHDGRLRPGLARAKRWNIAAAVIAALTSAGGLFVPLGMSSSTDSNGVQTTTRVSLLSYEGPSVLIVMAIPVLLVSLPLTMRGETASYRSRIAAVVLLSILVVLGALSIGLFFIPTLIAMIVSMSTQAAARSTPTAPAHPKA